MLAEPLNDLECLEQATSLAAAAVARPELHELAARLGSVAEAVTYIRRLPQRDDRPNDPTPGPRVACDTPQRSRVPAADPNCWERAILYLALAELLDPDRIRQLVTIELPSGERHTFPIEDGVPVWLDPIVRPNTLAAGLHRARNASGETGTALVPIDALSWAVHLAGDVVRDAPALAARHARAVHDVKRISHGLAPKEPAALSWALNVAVPEALAFGVGSHPALLAAAGLLDAIAGSTRPNK
jgi:hypothetical protein